MRTVIIVGGSQGIGLALVQRLHQSHFIHSISRSEPTERLENVTYHTCDVLKDPLPEISAADSLVYCPGSINLKPFKRLNADAFRQDFEINVIGAIQCTQQYLPVLKQSDAPAILLFSTVATQLGMPYHTSIATAKAGVEGLVKSLAAELAPTIRVNAIAPTVTDTPLASRLLRNDAMKAALEERHPLKLYLQPEEVAGFASYLISEEARSLTGQIMRMDSGIVSLKL